MHFQIELRTYLWGLYGAILALLISYLVQLLFNSIIIRNAILELPSGDTIKRHEIVGMLDFSFPIALQDSLFSIVHWLTTYILVSYANYGEVGIMSAASMWQSVVIFIPAMLKNVMFSYLSSIDNHSLLVKKLLLISFGSSAIPAIIVIVFSGIIASFYGESFVGLQLVLSICVLSTVFISLAEVYSYEFISTGHTWFVFSSRLIRDGLTLLISFYAISRATNSYCIYMSSIALGMHLIYYLVLHILYKHKSSALYAKE